MKKILNILFRDILSSTRDALSFYIIVVPIILAFLITIFVPGLNDTTISLAMLESDSKQHIDFMKDYAKVEVFNDLDDLENRVLKRDDTVGIVPIGNDEYEIVLQGNEAEISLEYSKILNSLYELDVDKSETTAEIIDFGRTVPPVKKMLVIMLISMVIMLAGMLIALGIVEEKAENTISAINVTPISQNAFIFGKSLVGGFSTIIGIIAALIITGFADVNWAMILIVALSSFILSMLIGFLQGLNSSDVIEAAAGVKMLMLPIAGSIAGYELLSDNWQWTMYWSPFYWAYKANDMILSKTADWSTVLMCTGLVIAISMAMYIIMMPRIRKGLQ